VRGWGSLIGVLFQTLYPDSAWAERYGDDDYKGGSPNTWLRKKYTGPYDYLGRYELYENAAREFSEFVEDYPNMNVFAPFDFRSDTRSIVKNAPVIDLTLDELNASIVIDDGTEDLLERLLVASVLAPEGMKTASSEELNQRMIKRWYNGYGEVEEPEVKPVTHKIIYYYDYGDGWVVDITRLENCDDLLEKNLITKDELTDAQNTVIDKYRPVCIHQDGMFVLDDVGGFGGFINLLKTLYESDDVEEKRQMREWTYSQGWSTRRVGNKSLL